MGVIVIETSAALVTVIDAAPDTVPTVACSIVVPGATPVAWPCEPAALLTIATVVLSLVHVTIAVMSAEVPSEYVPRAV